MAYTNVYSEAAPLGSVAANLIDDLMRSGKLDIRERLESIFGVGIFTTDPVTITQVKLTGASAKIIPGTVGLLIKDNADANININIADNGDFAVNRGRLLINASVSKLIPGATSFSVRNNADSADNILVTDAGLITVRNGITITNGGLVISTGGFTVSAGGISLVGDVTLGSRLLFSTAVGKVVPGATSLSIRNNADNRDNLLIDDLGNVTVFLQFIAKSNIIADRTGLGVDSNFVARGDAGHFKGFLAQNGSLSRWYIAANSTAESGANAGSDLVINRYDDTGIALAAAVTIIRSTGATTIAANLTIGTGLVVSAGGVTITAGALTFGAAVSQIVPGATSLSIRNNANSADSFLFEANGRLTIKGNAGIPALFVDQANGSATLSTYIILTRSGVNKARVGLDGVDNYCIQDSTGATAILTVDGTSQIVTVNQVVNVVSGYRIGGAAALGRFLRGDGNNFVSNTIQSGDLPTALTPTTLAINSGSILSKLLTGSTTVILNGGSSIASHGSINTSVTVTGAAVGDAVFCNSPWAADDANLASYAFVSGANTVTVVTSNLGTGASNAPTNRTVKAWVLA